MAHWNGSSESGILRKNIPLENHDDLLVFGYACKLFRDDEKALFIDQGKHLIPWMGDEKLKIDRYDCRGALSDLSNYEASKGGYDAMRWLGLSEKEINIEELCDKERYYSLKINEEEEEMYKEEELKRKKTNAIQYSYDVPQNSEEQPNDITTVPEENEVEEEYVPSPTLDVPVDIQIPKTVKENARIEKTALFVCKQGPQMEILIKAKQSDNPQFGFLNQGDPLYKYYRHVLAAFKNGRYQGYEPKNVEKTDPSQDATGQDFSSHYLHPSLISANPEPEPSTAVSIPQIPYKPSGNCAYSQLVSRIQGTQLDNQDSTKPATMTNPDFSQMTYEQQQYYQYYYAQQYYEYYKHMAMYQQGQGGNPGQFIPPADFQNLDPTIQSYIQQIAYNQYLQQQQQPQSDQNSYAQIVTNVNKEHNTFAINVPQLAENLPQQEDTSKAPIVYGPNPKPEEEERKVTIVKSDTHKSEVLVKKPILSLAAYGSSSESDDDISDEPKDEHEKKEVYKVPLGETQIVIDKMAVYVSKNGEQFEEIVKAKGDARFDFLNDGHEYNRYYREKIRELKLEKTSIDDNKNLEESNEVKKVKKEKKVVAPVSFSIKKAKEEPQKEIKSALPVEESDEEEEATAAASTIVSEKVLLNNKVSAPATNIQEKDIDISISVEDTSNGNEELKEMSLERNESQKIDIGEGDDLVLEMIERATDVESKESSKQAEEKIKDKLAIAAREKLAYDSRDRALQLERKRKAAAFLKLKSAQTNSQSGENPLQNPKSPAGHDLIEIIDLDDDDDEDPPEKKIIKKDRYNSRSLMKNSESRVRSFSRERSISRDRERRHKKKSRNRDGSRVRDKDESREKEKRSAGLEEEEYRRRRGEGRREKKKKSHKRKHSKSRTDPKEKKKSKKHRRKSDSESSNSDNSS